MQVCKPVLVVLRQQEAFILDLALPMMETE
jgi:hypothetical protein